MSTEKFVCIYCDFPDCRQKHVSQYSSVVAARREARLKRWVSSKGPAMTWDYCPEHATAERPALS
jgi:hypothetical protein